MDENDKPQPDVIIKKLVDKHGLNRAEITDIVNKCVQEKGADGCETAYKIFQCYRSNRVISDSFKKPKTSTAGVQSVTPSAVLTSLSPAGASSVKSVITGQSSTAIPKIDNINVNVPQSPPPPPPPSPLIVVKPNSQQQPILIH